MRSAEHYDSVIHFLYSPITSSHLGPNVFHSTAHHQPTFLPQCGSQDLAAMQTTDKTAVSYALIFVFLESRWKAKYSTPNDCKHSLTSICS